MFGTNRTVLRAGAGLTYDQEFGILRARVMRPNVGVINLPAVRGEAVPSLISGIRLNLPRHYGCDQRGRHPGQQQLPYLLLLRMGLAGRPSLLLQPHDSA